MIPAIASAERSHRSPLPDEDGEEMRSAGAGPSVAVPIAAPQTEVLRDPLGLAGRRDAALRGQASEQPLEQPVDPDQYVCGRGDSFELNFWGRQNFRSRATVDLEGRLFIAKVGYVEVVGKTLTAARTLIRQTVLRYYPGLKFDISLAAPRRFLVHVVDYVKSPGVYPATPLDRVGTVVERAGGLTGSRRQIAIRHRDGKVSHADLLLYDETGKTEYNPFVSDGDVIDVPAEGLAVTVAGPVHRPGRFELIGSKDLNELLQVAGGLKPEFTRQLPIRIVRRQAKREVLQQIRVAVKDAGPLPNVSLRPDDRVEIPSATELQRSILLIGAIKSHDAAEEEEGTATLSQGDAARGPTEKGPTVQRMPYVDGDTVRSLLERAGGVTSAADLKSAYVRRASGKIDDLDLEALLVRRDFSADRAVSMGDTVVVPKKRQSVLVEGSVLHPAAVPYNPRYRVADYVALSGGPTRMARSTSNYRVVRADGKTLRYHPDLILQPGDSIVVPERSFARSEVVQLVMGGASLILSSVSILLVVTQR